MPEKITDDYNGDFNEIKNNLNTCIDAVSELVKDADILVDAAIDGRLDTRADDSKHQGDFQAIVKGVNQTIEALVGHIDNVPSPIMIIDKEFNVVYMNNAGADIIGLPKDRIVGTKCFSHFKTSDCNTQKCACARAMQSNATAESETDAHPGSNDLEIYYTGNPIKNRDGDTIGALEIIMDQTEQKRAKRVADKQADYNSKEVEKVVGGLEKMAKGDLNFEAEAEEFDEDTKQIGENFRRIYHGIRGTVQAVQSLVEDTDTLAKAGIAGQLDTRADASKHQGDYAEVVNGINNTLDAILEPINEASDVLEKVAAQDMTARVTGDYKGDHAKIKNNLNSAVSQLDDALSQVSDATEQVSSAGQQISSGSQTLSQGANEQASSLEEVSSNLEEMSSQTKQNSQNANQAKTMSGEANKNAVTGAESMEKMSKTMEKIKDSSNKTSQIVKTIDEIAMQTNLLALNAAVEAARAGEAGRGFAVVAEEVRNLAQRSAEAAKNTNNMIQESVENADQGVQVSEEVAKSLESIREVSQKVNDLVAEVAAASDEQSKGIDQVNQAVSDLDKVTQQNASNSEESASAAEELASQAEELQGMVAQFTLTNSNGKKSAKLTAPATQKRKQLNGHSGNGASTGGQKSTATAKVSSEETIPMDEDELKKF